MATSRSLAANTQTEWLSPPSDAAYVRVSVPHSPGNIVRARFRLKSGTIKFLNVIWADENGVVFELRNVSSLRFRALDFAVRVTYQYHNTLPAGARPVSLS